jgi:hypothetical protein
VFLLFIIKDKIRSLLAVGKYKFSWHRHLLRGGRVLRKIFKKIVCEKPNIIKSYMEFSKN